MCSDYKFTKNIANYLIIKQLLLYYFHQTHVKYYDCSGLTSVTSLIEEPFDIDTETFGDDTYKNATLYVPAGTKEKYEATEGWKNFANIVEMDAPQDITPMDQGETIDFGNEIDEDTNLDGNVVGNVYIHQERTESAGEVIRALQ